MLHKHSLRETPIASYPIVCASCKRMLAPGQEMTHTQTGQTICVPCFSLATFPIMRKFGGRR